MNAFSGLLVATLLAASAVAQAADLPAYKAKACGVRLRVERPDVFVNGQVPRGPNVSLDKSTEGTFVGTGNLGASAYAGTKTASFPSQSGWLAQVPGQSSVLFPGDRVTLVNGGQASLLYADGTIYELTQPVTEIGPELCDNPPPAGFPIPAAVAGVAGLAAVAAGVTVGVTNNCTTCNTPNFPPNNSNPASP